MKIKYNNYTNRERKQQQQQQGGRHNNSQPRIKELRKIYENPKTFLRESLEVIEISVQEHLETMFNDYKEWRMGKKKRPEYIFNMTQDFAFVSILPKIVKKNYDFIIENGEEFSEIISNAVGELNRTRRNRYKEMVAIYSSLYEDLNERRIKKLTSLNIKGVDWDEALKLCLVSHGSPGHTMINTLRMMYSTLKISKYQDIYKILRKLYGKKDMGKVAVYILLEKRPDFTKSNWIDSELYGTLTSIALDEINAQKKDGVKTLLKLYCNERRRSEFEQYQRRRVNFSTINKEDYAKIHKVAKKLAKKNDMYRVYLDKSDSKYKQEPEKVQFKQPEQPQQNQYQNRGNNDRRYDNRDNRNNNNRHNNQNNGQRRY
jgi:hypothetical protein